MAADKFQTKIIVKETKVTHSGKTSTGGSYNLYQVIATRTDGRSITFNLRSFEDLPTNEVLDVECEIYRSQQYGDSYTVKRIGGNPKSASLGKAVDELRERVDKIEAFLQGRGEFGGTAVQQEPAQGQPPPPPPGNGQAAPPPPPPSTPAPTTDDQIPF
jgi:hypothetical protein